MTETPEARLKRLRMRSWRRGIKEMDLILGPYADAQLEAMDDAALAEYEALLDENDQDLYAWASGRSDPPAHLAPLIQRVAEFALTRSR